MCTLCGRQKSTVPSQRTSCNQMKQAPPRKSCND